MAPSTDCLLTLDLMFEAVPYSVDSIFWVWAICKEDKSIVNEGMLGSESSWTRLE